MKLQLLETLITTALDDFNRWSGFVDISSEGRSSKAGHFYNLIYRKQ